MTNSIQEKAQQVVELFNAFKQWEDRYRYLMKAGKNLAEFPVEFKIDANLVDGCESQVWLYHKVDNGVLEFNATSDARIVKGLLWVLISPLNGASANEISHFDIAAYFEQLALIKHLSPSRGNGLLSIAKQIQQISQQYL